MVKHFSLKNHLILGSVYRLISMSMFKLQLSFFFNNLPYFKSWFKNTLPSCNDLLILLLHLQTWLLNSYILLLQQNATPNKVSNMFAGTRDKCVGCKKTVYPIEKVIVLSISIIVIIFINSRDVRKIICNLSYAPYPIITMRKHNILKGLNRWWRMSLTVV